MVSVRNVQFSNIMLETMLDGLGKKCDQLLCSQDLIAVNNNYSHVLVNNDVIKV